MARLDGDMKSFNIGGRGGFAFSGARFDKLGASYYTLASLFIDVTGSVSGFEQQLRDMAMAVVRSCRTNPMADNILLRLALFSDRFQNGVNEIHGFKPLAEIDEKAYPQFMTGGNTPLNDAWYSGVGATTVFAEELKKGHYGANGLFYCVSDGGENASATTMGMVKDELKKAVQSEALESMLSILVGINTSVCGPLLQRFQQEAGINQYIDAGDATDSKLANIGGHASQSISSQSQAYGTGGPSQNIPAQI